MRNPWFERYNRGIYYSISSEQGKRIESAANYTVSDVNKAEHSFPEWLNPYNPKDLDNDSYNVLTSNCDEHARDWMQAGDVNVDTSINIDSTGEAAAKVLVPLPYALYQNMAPNEIYENAAGNIEDNQIAGDLGGV